MILTQSYTFIYNIYNRWLFSMISQVTGHLCHLCPTALAVRSTSRRWRLWPTHQRGWDWPARACASCALDAAWGGVGGGVRVGLDVMGCLEGSLEWQTWSWPVLPDFQSSCVSNFFGGELRKRSRGHRKLSHFWRQLSTNELSTECLMRFFFYYLSV